jgi:serine/threonine protein kinase
MDTITNYTIKSELGQGGMATVYLAEDKKFLTNVAVKVLAKEFAHNENIRKRFLAEARNMFKMSHPNIIKVSDLIEEGDTVAFVMEYIEGDTLKNYLERKGKLNDDEIKAIFTQMLAAVAYVHEQGLIHRDIKPSNFMISPKGQVKLLDFGIAKNTDSNSAEYTQTSTSQQMGTPMYMSPEQVNETKSVTAQSDIYSLGVVLWQMVMGQKPYDTKTLSNFELQLKIVQEPLVLTHTIWDNCIQKATHKNIESRYTSAQLFLNDLQPPETIKDDKTIFEDSDDKTILENKEEATIIEKVVKKEPFLEGSILSKEGKLKYGFINRQGNWVIQPMYDSLRTFDEQGFCEAELNGKWGVMNRQGNWVIQPMYDSLMTFDKQGFCEAELNGKWGVMNRQGNWVIQPMYDSLMTFDEQGFCTAQLNGKWGVINRQGNWVIQPMYDYLFSFDEQGFCEAELNEKCGFINRQGNWVIQPMYDSLGTFDEQGFCEAELNGKWGLINRQGNWVIQPMYDYLFSFDEQGFCRAELNGKGGLINRQGNWVIQPMYDSLMTFDEQGFCTAKLNGKWGVINRQGNWVIQPIYFLLAKTDNSTYKSSANNKYGYLDSQGNWIIKPQFDYVVYDELGDYLVWNEEIENWDQSISNSSDNNDFRMNDHFYELTSKHKVYLGSNIPDKKIDNFLNNFEFEDEEVLVYYDDTIFGKGDDGFAITYNEEYSFFFNMPGIRYVVPINEDTITNCEYSESKGVQLEIEIDGEIYNYEHGLKNDIGRALVNFIQSKLEDGFEL